jgi:tetratricopeptide (TPR) repeat protein
VPEYRQRLAVARSHLAQVLHKLGESKTAEDLFLSASKSLEDLCRSDPKSVSCRDALAFVYAHFGTILQETGRTDEAQSVLQKARQAWKDLVDRHHLPEHEYNLAWFLANGPMASLRDPQTAMKLAKQAIDKAPANPNYWRALGAACYRAGQLQAGMEAIQEAIRLRGHAEARDWFLRAMLQQQSGQSAEARKSYDQARKSMESNSLGNTDAISLSKDAAGLLKVTD